MEPVAQRVVRCARIITVLMVIEAVYGCFLDGSLLLMLFRFLLALGLARTVRQGHEHLDTNWPAARRVCAVGLPSLVVGLVHLHLYVTPLTNAAVHRSLEITGVDSLIRFVDRDSADALLNWAFKLRTANYWVFTAAAEPCDNTVLLVHDIFFAALNYVGVSLIALANGGVADCMVSFVSAKCPCNSDDDS